MSDENEKLSLQYTSDGAADLRRLDIADVARFIYQPKNRMPALNFLPYDDGEAPILVRSIWDQNRVSLPQVITHNYSVSGGTNAGSPFPRHFAASKGTLSFWLTSDFVADYGPVHPTVPIEARMYMAKRLEAFTRSLAEQCGIPSLEHRIFLPNGDLLKKLGGRTCGAVILGADVRDAPKLEREAASVIRRLGHEIDRDMHDVSSRRTRLDTPQYWCDRLMGRTPSLPLAQTALFGYILNLPETHKAERTSAITLYAPPRNDHPGCSLECVKIMPKDHIAGNHRPSQLLALWLHKNYTLLPLQARGKDDEGNHMSLEASRLVAGEMEAFVHSLEEHIQRMDDQRYADCTLNWNWKAPHQPKSPALLTIYADAKHDRQAEILEKLSDHLDEALTRYRGEEQGRIHR